MTTTPPTSSISSVKGSSATRRKNIWQCRLVQNLPLPGSTITANTLPLLSFLTCILYTKYPFNVRKNACVVEEFEPTDFCAIKALLFRGILTFEDSALSMVIFNGNRTINAINCDLRIFYNSGLTFGYEERRKKGSQLVLQFRGSLKNQYYY